MKRVNDGEVPRRGGLGKRGTPPTERGRAGNFAKKGAKRQTPQKLLAIKGKAYLKRGAGYSLHV